MAQMELTLDQARQNSASFLYIFASDTYLGYLEKKYATIIKGKRANQIKLLSLSAEKYLGSLDRYQEYKDAVREGFMETYGMEPADALVKLALGETVAGKNYEEGVYGIGSLPDTYAGHTDVTVDPTSGHIFKDGKDYTDESLTICDKVKGQVIPTQLFANIDEVTYASKYNKTRKKYYAHSYSNANGKYSATTGKEIVSTDAGSVFENIQLGFWDFLSWVKSVLAFFGINIATDGGKDTINTNNTLPNQKKDGYVTESGIGEAGAIALMLLAGGTLLASGGLKKLGKARK